MGKLFDISYMIQAFPTLAAELPTTLLVTAVSVFFGLLLGTVVAVIRMRQVPVLSQLGALYVSFIRGTPLIVQLFLFFFLIPGIVRLLGGDTRAVPLLLYAFVTCSIHLSGFFAETLRGALIAVGTSQLEAAYAVGMNTWQAYTRLLLPQAFSAALPDTSSLVINTLKNTSLLFNIGLLDIMTRAKFLAGYSQRGLEMYLDVGILYIIISLGIYLGFRQLEKRRVVRYGQ